MKKGFAEISREIVAQHLPGQTRELENRLEYFTKVLDEGGDIRRRPDSSDSTSDFGPAEAIESWKLVMLCWSTYKAITEIRKHLSKEKDLEKELVLLLTKEGFDEDKASDIVRRILDAVGREGRLG
jgi:hypothetical protein